MVLVCRSFTFPLLKPVRYVCRPWAVPFATKNRLFWIFSKEHHIRDVLYPPCLRISCADMGFSTLDRDCVLASQFQHHKCCFDRRIKGEQCNCSSTSSGGREKDFNGNSVVQNKIDSLYICPPCDLYPQLASIKVSISAPRCRSLTSSNISICVFVV